MSKKIKKFKIKVSLIAIMSAITTFSSSAMDKKINIKNTESINLNPSNSFLINNRIEEKKELKDEIKTNENFNINIINDFKEEKTKNYKEIIRKNLKKVEEIRVKLKQIYIKCKTDYCSFQENSTTNIENILKMQREYNELYFYLTTAKNEIYKLLNNEKAPKDIKQTVENLKENECNAKSMDTFNHYIDEKNKYEMDEFVLIYLMKYYKNKLEKITKTIESNKNNIDDNEISNLKDEFIENNKKIKEIIKIFKYKIDKPFLETSAINSEIEEFIKSINELTKKIYETKEEKNKINISSKYFKCHNKEFKNLIEYNLNKIAIEINKYDDENSKNFKKIIQNNLDEIYKLRKNLQKIYKKCFEEQSKIIVDENKFLELVFSETKLQEKLQVLQKKLSELQKEIPNLQVKQNYYYKELLKKKNEIYNMLTNEDIPENIKKIVKKLQENDCNNKYQKISKSDDKKFSFDFSFDDIMNLHSNNEIFNKKAYILHKIIYCISSAINNREKEKYKSFLGYEYVTIDNTTIKKPIYNEKAMEKYETDRMKLLGYIKMLKNEIDNFKNIKYPDESIKDFYDPNIKHKLNINYTSGFINPTMQHLILSDEKFLYS